MNPRRTPLEQKLGGRGRKSDWTTSRNWSRVKPCMRAERVVGRWQTIEVTRFNIKLLRAV
jgi:hypothetical protein